jgi:hypothetical protein
MPVFQWEHNVVANAVEKCRYVVVSVFPNVRILGLVETKSEAEELAKGANSGYINVVARINGIRYK